MHDKNLIIAFVILLAAPSFAQSVSVHAQAHGGPIDARPFGKYLLEICTLAGAGRTLSCVPTPLAQGIDRAGIEVARRLAKQIDQTITLKLVCDPAQQNCNEPSYPLQTGSDFFVSAKADSGNEVRQTVISGSATPVGGTGVVRYRANRSGVVVIRANQEGNSLHRPAAPWAEQPGNSLYRPAAPVDLILQVVDSPNKASNPCSLFPAPPIPTSAPLDAGAIISLLGNPTPFVLAAQGPNTIAIYSTRYPLISREPQVLRSFQAAIGDLARRTAGSLSIAPAAKAFTVELTVPHAAALGDLAARINGLNYSQFTAQNVGSSQVRVTSPSQPECAVWTSFLTDLRRTAWQLLSEPMNKKLFYLSSSDVVAGFSSLSSSSSAPPSGAVPSPAPSAAGPNTAATASNATISITQPPGSNIQISSDTTPCVAAGLAFGSTNACAPAPAAAPGGSSSGAGASASAPKTPLGMASVAIGTNPQSPPDLLVFSDANPGDDAQVEERLRVIAQLDLPRPEMIINAWVTQNSSSNPQAMGAFTNLVKGMVAEYNSEFENVVFTGWASVQRQSEAPGGVYFNEAFRSYIEDRFVADAAQQKPGSNPQDLAQAFLNHTQGTLIYPLSNDDKVKGPRICPKGRYCLGYNSLFHPLKPALTDLLLTIIAAQDPVEVTHIAVAAIETGDPAANIMRQIAHEGAETKAFSDGAGICDANAEGRARCKKIWLNLDLDYVTSSPQLPSCANKDYHGVLYSLFQNSAHRARVHLYCLKEQIDRLLLKASKGTVPGAGLLRAAIADFLFNYKISQQYPHEFTSYDLTHSADALNNALSPLIDAFNRDITAYQLFMRADMQYQTDRLNARNGQRCCIRRLFGLDKPSFFNDGLITVRTISGQTAAVNTTTQSLLNVSTAPELTTLLSSLNANGGDKAPGTNSLASTVLPSLGPSERVAALAGLLANFQSSHAQIGRSLNVAVSPRSLSTASSAEISVTLNADESAAPALFSAVGTPSDPVLNTSRVASHDTTTRVRIDSIRLFEVSSLTAILERSRSRFPLLPPFVEIPYIGTLAGIPLGAAKEFHNSTAILSAYVMPTATDLAYGLRFVSDLVVDSLNPGSCTFYKGAAGPNVTNVCLFRKALSLRDFGNRGVSNFNKIMIRCMANDSPSAYCEGLTFDDVPGLYR